MIQIGTIQGYYGGLVVKENEYGYYWGIESYDCIEWEPIPEYLYDALIRFNRV